MSQPDPTARPKYSSLPALACWDPRKGQAHPTMFFSGSFPWPALLSGYKPMHPRCPPLFISLTIQTRVQDAGNMETPYASSENSLDKQALNNRIWEILIPSTPLLITTQIMASPFPTFQEIPQLPAASHWRSCPSCFFPGHFHPCSSLPGLIFGLTLSDCFSF